MKILMMLYFKLLNWIEKIGEHRIEGGIGLLTGIFSTLQVIKGNKISTIAILVIGITILELFKKYLGTEPDVVFMTKSPEENKEEFFAEMQEKVTKTLKDDD
jgi:hypothetical protein